jgi:hypothetical protein
MNLQAPKCISAFKNSTITFTRQNLRQQKKPLYDEEEEGAHKFVPITDPTAFLSNMLGLHNHIQINNSYTMSLANRKDDEEKPKLQHPTYVVLRCTTKYTFERIVGLIQSCLTEVNMFLKERECQVSIQEPVWPL